MAELNDFTLVKHTSTKYFDLLRKPNQKEFETNQKARFGFYLLGLECITNVKDEDELTDMINDGEFLREIKGIHNDDLGIDALYFDEDKKVINLFNFKHRNQYHPDKAQGENEAYTSTKFLNSLLEYEEVKDSLTKKTKFFIEKIRDKYYSVSSDEAWEMKLVMVSNDNKPIKLESPIIDTIKKIYGLEIISYTLDDFSKFIIKKPKGNEASLSIPQNSIFSYEEAALDSSKSYILRISIADLIRITSTDTEYRRNSRSGEEDKLEESKLDLSLLFDNVRGYLGDTDFNKNILKTLEQDPTKFFMFNNGITMTSEEIYAKENRVHKELDIKLSNYQIVNGGQTLRTLYKFSEKHSDLTNLFEGSVLLRLFETGEDRELTNKIAEYTNSQNAISSIDLKSMDPLQIKIEKFLSNHNILYVRKVGDVGERERKYDQRISMEKLGQLLYALYGYPDRSSNQKKRIFDKYYEEVFGDENFNIEDTHIISKKYQEIKSLYHSTSYEEYDQKVFYAIFLSKYNKDDQENIQLIEEALSEYRKGESLSPARKLIQKGFKDQLIEIFEEKHGIEIEIE